LVTDAQFIGQLTSDMLSGHGTLWNTLELAERCIVDNVPGDFVECGVYRGVHPAVMAYACQKHGVTNRRVHLFDSFAGIPESGPRDDETITGCIHGGDRLVSVGHSVCSVEDVQRRMRQWGVDASLLVYHKGWFQQTVKPAAAMIDAIAILRLDCDLYTSTMACLPSLYPKLSRGGYYISDDYTLTGAKLATDEYLTEIGERPEVVMIQEGIGAHYWRI
jgi:O-methyltransferase